jgi:hypothetical protein
MSESLLGGNSAPTTETPANSPAPTTPNPAPSVVIPENWKDSLPDDLKADPSLSSIMDIQSLAKSYVHGQKMIGKDKIIIPDKFATDEDWNKVYQKLGLPESPDKYDIKIPEGMDEDFVKGFKEIAVKNGILPRQADKLFEFYNSHVEKVISTNEAENKKFFEESVNGLKKEWGQAYERKLQAASGLFNQIADEESKKVFNESGIGNNPVVIKMFAKLAEQMGEDKFVNANNLGSMGLTPSEAQQKINEIYGNKDHPYYNKSHPSHKDALNEMTKLFEAVAVKR